MCARGRRAARDRFGQRDLAEEAQTGPIGLKIGRLGPNAGMAGSKSGRVWPECEQLGQTLAMSVVVLLRVRRYRGGVFSPV